MSEIAQGLCFSEVAFSHAWRRWFAQPFSALRRWQAPSPLTRQQSA